MRINLMKKKKIIKKTNQLINNLSKQNQEFINKIPASGFKQFNLQKRDLSNFVTYNKQESLLLSVAKSILDIVENTLSKPQETLELKMNKQKESFSFDIPLELPEQWMMGVTSLEVYNTVYNITEKNNKIKLFETDKMLKEYQVATEFMSKIKELYETSGNKGLSNIEEIKKLINDVKFKKVVFPENYYNELEKVIGQINKYIEDKTNILDLYGIGSVSNCLRIEIPPGAYEINDISNTIQQEFINSCGFYSDFKFNIEADTISMKSVLTTSYSIYFNSELNTLLGFTNKGYTTGTHISEKPVMITTTDKVHLKCDCVDGSIVNGIREQILFSFNLSAPPGYKIIKEPNIILYKKTNKTRLDSIQFFLEDSNHNPVDFNGETLTFTIQIIEIYS